MCGDEDFEWLTALAGGENLGTGAGDQAGVGVSEPMVNIEDSPVREVDPRDVLRASPLQVVSPSGLEKETNVGHGSASGSHRPHKEAPPRDKKRKSDADTRVDPSVARKRKSSRKHKSSSGLSLDSAFVKRNFETYCADPVAASVNVFVNLADVVKGQMQAAEDRARVAEEERDREKELKNQVQARLEEAQKSLTKNRGELIKLQEYYAKSEMEKEADAQVMAQLRSRITMFENKVKESETETGNLERRIIELEGALKKAEEVTPAAPELSARIAELEAEVGRQKDNAKRAAQYALGMREKGFSKALQQVYVVNPGMQSIENGVFKVDHEVEDGKIVKVDKASKSKTVIYPPVSGK